MATDTRSIFLSDKKKTFKNMDNFYELGQEVVLKHREFNDDTHHITSIVKLEEIARGGLYHARWSVKSNSGSGYEVLTSGYIVTYTTEDGQNETMCERVEFFSKDQLFMACDLVIRLCQMLSA